MSDIPHCEFGNWRRHRQALHHYDRIGLLKPSAQIWQSPIPLEDLQRLDRFGTEFLGIRSGDQLLLKHGR